MEFVLFKKLCPSFVFMWVDGVRHKNLMVVNGMGGKLALRFRALIVDDPSHVYAIPATVYTINATVLISIISTYESSFISSNLIGILKYLFLIQI